MQKVIEIKDLIYFVWVDCVNVQQEEKTIVSKSGEWTGLITTCDILHKITDVIDKDGNAVIITEYEKEDVKTYIKDNYEQISTELIDELY